MTDDIVRRLLNHHYRPMVDYGNGDVRDELDPDIAEAAAEIERLRELFRIDGEQHAAHIKEVRHEQDIRFAAYNAEIEQLRAAQFRSEKAEVDELRKANATMYIEIELLRTDLEAALLSCPCSGVPAAVFRRALELKP